MVIWERPPPDAALFDGAVYVEVHPHGLRVLLDRIYWD